MLNITINKKDYEIPNKWSEMTLEYYCGIYEIIKKYQRTEEQNEEDEGKDLSKFFFVQETRMYRELFIYMTNIDNDTMDKIPMEDVESVIKCLDNIMEKYEPKGITHFVLNHDTYYFPMDFLRTGTFGEYIESSQLEMNTEYLKNGRFDILPEQMAILCKQVDEELDLDNIDEKTKLFKQIKMDIVWEFSFFLNKRAISSLSLIQTFLGEEQIA
jgi:hypothetical protein